MAYNLPIRGTPETFSDSRPNDYEEYLGRGSNMKTKRVMGESKGSVKTGNYGSRKTNDDKIYSDRGLKHPDDAKIKQQMLPNTRMYTYVE